MEPTAIVFWIGPLGISTTVVTTWGIMLALGGFSALATRRLTDSPGALQTVLEGIVTAIEDAVTAVMPQGGSILVPFIGTLWVFLVIANLTGIVPGLHSPTADLSLTAALAFLVFLAVHWYGARAEGLRVYARHYFSPNPLMET